MNSNILIAIICLAASALGRSQGTVNFANAGPGFNAQVHIETITGPFVTSSSYMAQLLLVGPGGSLTPVGAAANFIAGANGYFNGGVVTVSQVAPGATATFLVFAWDGASGQTTYAAALAAFQRGLIGGGYSQPTGGVTIATGGAGNPASPPAGLFGLLPWFVTIPEPSIILLGLMGAGALMLPRRR
jgi:hypothetical protein